MFNDSSGTIAFQDFTECLIVHNVRLRYPITDLVRYWCGKCALKECLSTELLHICVFVRALKLRPVLPGFTGADWPRSVTSEESPLVMRPLSAQDPEQFLLV